MMNNLEHLLHQAGVTQAKHLPPVGLKGFILLRPRVQQVLNKIVERWTQARCIRLVHCLWWIGLAAVKTQNVPAKVLVVVLIEPLELVSIGGDETDKWVPNKQKLGVVLQPCLQSRNECFVTTYGTNRLQF